jgi:hypothetical protein
VGILLSVSPQPQERGGGCVVFIRQSFLYLLLFYSPVYLFLFSLLYDEGVYMLCLCWVVVGWVCGIVGGVVAGKIFG